MLNHYERERLIWRSALPASEKLLALALNSFVDGSGECFPGQERLSEMCGATPRTIRNLCKSLETKGVIVRVHRYKNDGTRNSDRYKLIFSALPENVAASQPENVAASASNSGHYRKNATSLPENDDTTTGKFFRGSIQKIYPVLEISLRSI